MANDIKVTITAEDRQFLSEMRSVMSYLKTLETQAKTSSASINTSMAGIGSIGHGGLFDGLMGDIAKATLAAQGLIGILREIKSLATSFAAPGFRFATMMESGRLGMAGTLVSMGEINGQAIAFGDALKIADKLMKELNQDAILTSATTSELVTVFQGLLAPGMGKGMTLEQIREFTKVGVNAVKSMNLPQQQYLQELRALIQGGIRPAADQLAAALGVDDAAIKKAQQSTEGLFAFLMKKLEGFKYSAAAFPDTIAGAMSQMEEYGTLASAKFTEAFKPEIRALMDWLQGEFGSLSDEGFEVNPLILEMIDKAKAGFDGLIGTAHEVMEVFGSFDVDNRWYPSEETVALFEQAGGYAKDIVQALLHAAPLVASIASALWTWHRRFVQAADFLEQVINPDLETTEGEFTKIDGVIRLTVDALMGWFVIGKIITLVESLGTAVGLVARGYIAIKNAIKGATLAQMAFNVAQALGALAKHPVALGLGIAGIGALGGAFMAGAFDEQIKSLKDKLNSAFGDDDNEEWKELFKQKEKQKDDGSGPNPNDVTGHPHEDEEALKKALREQVKASQAALRQEVALLKAALDEQLEAYKNHLESITLSFKQNTIGWQEASLAEAQTKVDEEQAKVDQLTAQLAATEKATYNSDEEREAAVSAVQIALEKEQRALDKATAGLDDVKRVISEVKARPAVLGQGTNAATGSATELGEAVAKAGKDLVDSGVTYKELVCTQLVAKSWDAVGLEDALQKAGIDTTGDGGNDMRDWVPALYEVAERLGALHFPGEGYVPKAGDAGIVYGQNHAFMFTGANTGVNSSGRNGGDTPANYVDDVEAAYGGEFDAIVDFQKLCIAAGLESAENLRSNNALLSDQIKATTEAGYEALQKAKQSEKEAQGVLKDYYAIIGDVFNIPAEELKQQYEVLRQKLAANAPAEKKEEILAALDKVLKNKLIGLKIEQISKNLDYALEVLRDDAERYTAGIANGLLDSHEAFEKYTKAHAGALTAILEDLHRQLEAAITESNLEQQKNVRAKIKSIRQELQSIFDSFISAIDKDAEWRSNMVEANWRMTDSQRKHAKDGIERERHAKTAKEERAEAEDKRRRIGKNLNMLEGVKDSQMRREIEKEILSLQNQEIDLTRLARYHEELAYLKTELEEVGVVAKQSLEDNLVTFLTDGINEAENLADALRDLVTGVLKDLQRYFAENITRNLMDSWFPAMDNMQGMQGDAMEAQVAGAEVQLQSLLGTSQEFVAGFSSQMQELSMNLDMVFQEIVTAARSASMAVMSMAGSVSSAGSSSGAGYADGGFITGPGTGTSDSIHAMLSNGEFVVKAEAVKRYGLAVLERINNGTWGNMVVSVPKFAGGGLVGDAGAAIAEKFVFGASAPTVTTQVNNYVDGRRIFDAYAKEFIRSEVRQQTIKDAKRNSLIERRMR